MKNFNCFFALFLFVVATPAASQELTKPLLSIDITASPIAISRATLETSAEKFGVAELVVSAAGPRKLDEVGLLITYWKDDQPVGGHCARVTADSLYKIGVARVSLKSHIRDANRVLISVASVTSANRVWRKPSSGTGPEFLRSALYGTVYRLADEDWVQFPNLRKASTTLSEGCGTSLKDCTHAATTTCGSAGVGGVSYSASTCCCAFYCAGQAANSCDDN